MPQLAQAQVFERSISQLLTKRKEYSDGLAQIDGIFAKYRISIDGHREGNGLLGTATRRAAGTSGTQKSTKRTAGSGKRRPRATYKETASEFISNLLKGKSLTTAEINAAWKKQRKGTADNNLSAMFKTKQIKRTANKDGQGSNYSLA